MKYKATEKNKLLPTGAEFTFDSDNRMIPILALYTDGWQVEQNLQNDWINSGWCEEIQEPEFTQREMKDRCVKFLHNYSGYSLNNAIEIYDNWIKGKEQALWEDINKLN